MSKNNWSVRKGRDIIYELGWRLIFNNTGAILKGADSGLDLVIKRNICFIAWVSAYSRRSSSDEHPLGVLSRLQQG
ncbi:hypothetical protein I352_05385 [Cryptococcus deuterogattii MMRL2647]|nr:hypothetical protein I352_05385 [Cryptococcus deuterogattii MMRL2647]